MILVGTPASHWAAMGRWTPEYIEAKVPVFKDAYRHAQPVFTFYDPGKPLAALPAVKDDLRAAHNIVRRLGGPSPACWC